MSSSGALQTSDHVSAPSMQSIEIHSVESLLAALQTSQSAPLASELRSSASSTTDPTSAPSSSLPYKPNLQVDVSDISVATPAESHNQQQPPDTSPSKHDAGSSSNATPKSAGAQQHKPTNVFVAGLPSAWDDKKLRERFQEFGEVVSVRVVPSRHFGFVMFRNPEAAQAAIKGAHLTRPTAVCSSLMHVTLSMHDEGFDDEPNERVFVRGLPQWATKEHLRATFAKFGSIQDCTILMNNLGQCKGAGFITFSSIDEARCALEGGQTARIENWDFDLEVKYSETQEVHQQRQERNRDRFRFSKSQSPTTTPTASSQLQVMQNGGLFQAPSQGLQPPSYLPSVSGAQPPILHTPQGLPPQFNFGLPPMNVSPPALNMSSFQSMHSTASSSSSTAGVLGTAPPNAQMIFMPHLPGMASQQQPPQSGMQQQSLHVLHSPPTQQPTQQFLGTPSSSMMPQSMSQHQYVVMPSPNGNAQTGTFMMMPHTQQMQPPFQSATMQQQQHPPTPQGPPPQPYMFHPSKVMQVPQLYSQQTLPAHNFQQQQQTLPAPNFQQQQQQQTMPVHNFQQQQQQTLPTHSFQQPLQQHLSGHSFQPQQQIMQANTPHGQPTMLLQQPQHHQQVMYPNSSTSVASPFPTSGDLCISGLSLSEETIRGVVAQKYRNTLMVDKVALVSHSAQQSTFAVRLTEPLSHLLLAQQLNGTVLSTGNAISAALFLE